MVIQTPPAMLRSFRSFGRSLVSIFPCIHAKISRSITAWMTTTTVGRKCRVFAQVWIYLRSLSSYHRKTSHSSDRTRGSRTVLAGLLRSWCRAMYQCRLAPTSVIAWISCRSSLTSSRRPRNFREAWSRASIDASTSDDACLPSCLTEFHTTRSTQPSLYVEL